jgi:hypothetical protein
MAGDRTLPAALVRLAHRLAPAVSTRTPERNGRVLTPSTIDPQMGLLLCDGCFQASTGELAQCEYGCPQGLDHTGLCLRDSTSSCQWCGSADRLHSTAVAQIWILLTSVGEEEPGQWFLHWQEGLCGPHLSEQAAWDAWHASGPEPVPSWH